jgi:ATP-dependent Zn protease
MKSWVQYVIAFLVFCHGFVYLRVGSMLPAPVKDGKEAPRCGQEQRTEVTAGEVGVTYQDIGGADEAIAQLHEIIDSIGQSRSAAFSNHWRQRARATLESRTAAA